ncbi:hypothetical protein ABPG75_002201 [Micractinium tetrahymenae]
MLGQSEVPRGQDDSYVAVCVSVKDEHCDIREWILYHALLGMRKFYIFDTESPKPVLRVLDDDMIASGLVEYKYLTVNNTEIPVQPPPPGKGINWQLPIYEYCLETYKETHRWMAFFDVDEFIMLEPGISSIPQLLKRFEEHPGVVLHRQMFGPNGWSGLGHINRPALGLLRSYTCCCPRTYFQHGRVKSIVQPLLTLRPRSNVHRFQFRKGHAVNTLGQNFSVTTLLEDELHLVTYKHAWLAHYISKSLDEFLDKLDKRGAAGNSRKITDFVRWSRDCTDTCTAGLPWGQKLAARFDLQRGVPKRCCKPPPLPVLSTEDMLEFER